MKNLLIALVLIINAVSLCAQTTPTKLNQPKMIYYLDGKPIAENKLDSIVKEWGSKLSMSKRMYGNDSVIVHLVKQTDEMIKKDQEAQAQRLMALKNSVGQPAKNFTLKDLNGKNYTLTDLKGKIVVLNFWFTVCAPCIQEMPALNSLTQKYDPSKVVFLALTFNEVDVVKSFLQQKEFKYNILPNSKEVDKLYGISSWPTNIVIDKTGVIRFAKTYSEKIEEEIETVINAI